MRKEEVAKIRARNEEIYIFVIIILVVVFLLCLLWHCLSKRAEKKRKVKFEKRYNQE